MTSMTRRALFGGLTSASVLCLAGRARADVPSFGGVPRPGGPDRNQAWDAARLVDAWGSRVGLLEAHKPLVFVNLWANWCSGCILEMASLERMATLVGGDRMAVLLVSHPGNWMADQRFAEVHRIGLPLVSLAANNPDWVIDGAYGNEPGQGYEVPQSLVFDGRSGEIVWTSQGMQDWASPEMVGRLSGMANR